MNYRTKIITLSSFIVLFSVTFVLGLFLLPHGPFASRDRTVVPEFDSTAVSKIEIQLAPADSALGDDRAPQDGRIVLIKTGGDAVDATDATDAQWQHAVGGKALPARSQNVETLLQNVGELIRYRTVANTTALHAELGVEEGSGARLRLYDDRDTVLVDIIQGNIDERRGVYARLNQSDTVELIGSELVFYLEQQSGYWQQTMLFASDVQVSDVSSVAIFADAVEISPDEAAITADYRLVRTASNAQGIAEWQVAGSEDTALDQLQVDNVALAILSLEADSFSEIEADEIDFDSRVQMRVSVELSDGTQHLLEIAEDAAAKPGAYLLRTFGPRLLAAPDGSAYVYHINSFSLRPFIRPLDALFPPVELGSN